MRSQTCQHVQLRETFLKAEPMRSRSETYAAVRKALAQLDDPFTRFLGPQQYQVAPHPTMQHTGKQAFSMAWLVQRPCGLRKGLLRAHTVTCVIATVLADEWM